MKRSIILTITVFGTLCLVFIGLSLVYLSQRLIAPENAIPTPTVTPADTDTTPPHAQTTTPPTLTPQNNGTSIDTKISSYTTSLKDVSGGNSRGTASLVVVNNDLTHNVTANLPDPPVGSVYEGWLVNSSTGDFFSTGVMGKFNNQYQLQFKAEQDYRGYLTVVITLETIVDNTPEQHILEGSFE